MILQKLLFPNADTCARGQMYYKGDDITVYMEDAYAAIGNGATIGSHTYFNSFSIGKWKKYTILSNLKLRLTVKGEFQLTVRFARRMYRTTTNEVIAEQHICAAEKSDAVISIPVTENEGIVYFELKAMCDGAELWGGAFETDVDESALPHVKVGIGICTFRREAFVAHNMQVLRETILENPDCPMHGHLEVFISDNSRTLSSELETEDIHIFPNRNLGGAGGFTRTLIEIKNVRKEKNITHILLMDDDIRLNPDSLLRTYAMLRMIKPEHRDAFIGGHMLRIDSPHIQSEAADH